VSTFDNPVSAVAQSCSYQPIQAISHIRHLLAQTLACSLVLSRLDYCNALLHGTPTGNIDKLQRVQNSAARGDFTGAKAITYQALLHELHWLPVKQRISYKLAVLTSRSAPLRQPHISAGTSKIETSGRPYARLLQLRCLNLPPTQPSASELSAAQLRPPGTLFHVLLLTATRLELLNLV